MSFSMSAVGDTAAVLEQVAKVESAEHPELVAKVKDFVSGILSDIEHPFGVRLSASGHQDVHGASVTLSLVPQPAPEGLPAAAPPADQVP